MPAAPRLLAVALSALALGLAACGDAETEENETSPETPGGRTAQTAPAGAAAEGGGGPDAGGGADVSSIARQITEDTGQKPEIPAGSGQPPDRLVTRDIVEGDGATARPGDTVTVQYVGALFDSGRQFDASWDLGEPFIFQLGAGQVIPGWDEGISGMKVGGRRLLVIPPGLAYGPQGAPPDIPPNSTLSFVVDLESIEQG